MFGNKRKSRERYNGLRVGMMLVLVLLICVGMKQSVAAEDTLLNRNQAVIYVGDQLDLQEYVNEEYQKDVQYQWEGDASDSSVAELTKEGKVKAVSAGEVKVQVSYLGQPEVSKEEILYISIIAPEQLSMEYGSETYLEAEELYGADVLSYSSSKDSVVVSEKGMLVAQGFQDAQITAAKKDGTSFVVAQVTILEPRPEKTTIVRAAGTKGYPVEIQYFSYTDASENIVWNIADETIATWDANGCNALKKGSTKADIVLTAKNGDQKTLAVQIIVTDPKLSTTSIIMAAKTSHKLTVAGTHTSSEVIWGDHAGSPAYFSSAGVIYGSTAGTVTLKVTVDGRELTCKVQVTDPTYQDLTIILYKGQAKKLKLKGTASKSSIAYSSSNKKVLTISKTGNMKAKKVGHATVKVTVDGRKLSILAEISSKKGYQAMKKAIAISKTKTKYSQARRMSKGYYDCSSLVSRVYRKYGVYFGSRKGWSPTAATIGKWCVRNHKVVARKAVSYKKLLPGDIIFFSGWKNGRYKNITHVEMYTGGATDVSASSSYNKVVHYGYSKASNIVLIARPTK
ncbi:MAG: Ig-like domain-containing protein [Eubacteriales bacterium]|nr:Ig-like domain-containing protein [Eubacteriales bacterium]